MIAMKAIRIACILIFLLLLAIFFFFQIYSPAVEQGSIRTTSVPEATPTPAEKLVGTIPPGLLETAVPSSSYQSTIVDPTDSPVPELLPEESTASPDVQLTPKPSPKRTSPRATSTSVSTPDVETDVKDISYFIDGYGNFKYSLRILDQDTEVRQTPLEGAFVNGIALANTEYPIVRISDNGWYEIALETGVTGYVPSNKVTRLSK